MALVDIWRPEFLRERIIQTMKGVRRQQKSFRTLSNQL